MKKILIILFLFVTYLFLAAQQDVIFTCPMHSQIKMQKPGNCPKCGMALIAKKIKVAANNKPGDFKIPEKKMPVQKLVEGRDVNKSEETKPDTTARNKTSREEAVEIYNENSSHLNFTPGKIIRYDLYVRDTVVNYTGKQRHAIAINGSIPGPTLRFTEGDSAEIYLHNMLRSEQTSLHWHGVILPNRFDGVPYLTTAPIRPGETHLYKFKVVQNGTYWYHSHSGLQEQSGMYGALIFQKRQDQDSLLKATKLFDKEYTLLLSEWTDENPREVQRRLRTGNDWYSIKKGSTQSYSEAISEGHLKVKLINEWKRMKAMDVSDVYYNRFLVNGKTESDAPEFKAGDKIKLRIVNGSASTYFWLQYAGGKIIVTGSDGNDVQPVAVDRLIVAPAETYDLIVAIPQNNCYEFRATPEDRTGSSSLWLGSGAKIHAPVLPRLNYFDGMMMMNDMMKTNGQMKDMDMQMSLQQMDMNVIMYPEMKSNIPGKDTLPMDSSRTLNLKEKNKDPVAELKDTDMNTGSDIVTLNYDMLRSTCKTSLPQNVTRILHFNLTGNMNRYLWTLDNKTVSEADRILIKQGETVRLVLTNNSMMRHPIHLHGHDFRVINSQGDYAPLKNVIDIMPMETDTVEFAANQSGDWFFHCHILYHMMAGMGRVFTYDNSPPNPELPNNATAYRMFKKDNNMQHFMAKVGIESNGSDGEAMYSTDRWAVQQMWHLGSKPHHGYESETMVGRYLGENQWLYPYIGFDYHYKKENNMHMDSEVEKNLFGQVSDKNNRKTFMAGVQYTLPWLVYADIRLDGNGKARFQLSREDVPLTPRLRLNFMGNTDKEYMVGFRYILSKWFALSTHYDSDMGLGAGITLSY